MADLITKQQALSVTGGTGYGGGGLSRGALRVGTSETPAIALLRHCIFPASAVLGLVLSALIVGQPFTRPYFIVAILSFVLSWPLLGATECNELRPSSQIEFFVPRMLLGWTKVFGILLFIGFVAKSS